MPYKPYPRLAFWPDQDVSAGQRRRVVSPRAKDQIPVIACRRVCLFFEPRIESALRSTI